MPEIQPVKVAVVGCGAFGRHHARIYSQMPGAVLVGVYDRDEARARAVAAEYGAPVLASLDEVAKLARAASIATPTSAHAVTALRLMDAGLDVLIEKPIASSLEESDRLIEAAKRGGNIVQVGHLERFNPAVRLIRPRLTRPLFFEVHRLSVFTPRSLDVDVLLDLMIHDLDIVLSFVNSPLTDLQAVGLPVLTPYVDIANVRLSFANGCVANLTASRVSTERVRKLRFFQPGEYISLDYARRDARVFKVKTGGGPTPEISHEHLTGDEREPLLAEIEHFLDCVRTRRAPEIDATGARAALATALRAAAEIQRHAAAVGVH